MLSTTAEHALRALTEMAALGETESILGKDLALRAGIPANYLSKVLWVLGNAEIIDATRGTGGGYRLRRKAAEIRLSEVVELFDRQKPERRCLLGGGLLRRSRGGRRRGAFFLPAAGGKHCNSPNERQIHSFLVRQLVPHNPHGTRKRFHIKVV